MTENKTEDYGNLDLDALEYEPITVTLFKKTYTIDTFTAEKQLIVENLAKEKGRAWEISNRMELLSSMSGIPLEVLKKLPLAKFIELETWLPKAVSIGKKKEPKSSS